MAFTEDTLAGAMNSTSYVTLAIGDANGTKLVKNLVIHNEDTVSHIVIIELYKSSVAYRMFKITLAPDDSLVQDVLLALVSSSYTFRAKLGEAATTQPKFVVTLAQHS
jgi:hypothetical protein